MILISVAIILMIVTTIPITPMIVSGIISCTFHFIFHYVSPPKYRKFSNVVIWQKVNRLPFRAAPVNIIINAGNAVNVILITL